MNEFFQRNNLRVEYKQILLYVSAERFVQTRGTKRICGMLPIIQFYFYSQNVPLKHFPNSHVRRQPGRYKTPAREIKMLIYKYFLCHSIQF